MSGGGNVENELLMSGGGNVEIEHGPVELQRFYIRVEIKLMNVPYGVVKMYDDLSDEVLSVFVLSKEGTSFYQIFHYHLIPKGSFTIELFFYDLLDGRVDVEDGQSR